MQGLGFAATRDFVSWLQHDPKAAEVTGRPISHALAIGFSQAGRYLRHHSRAGFNRDEQGRKVFDGIHSHIAGVGRLFFNMPFSQPARTNTQHEDHAFPESWFPFSTATLEDPLTKQKGSLLRGDGSDPLLIETNTSTEYWQKGASLLTTDPLGTKDVALPDNSRAYMIAGTQHGGRAGATTDPGPNVNPRNPHNPMPAVRALLVALDDWVVSGKAPPPSRVPTLGRRHAGRARQDRLPGHPGRRRGERDQPGGAAGRLGEAQPAERPIARWSAGSIPTATKWPASACPTSPCRSPPTPAGTSTSRPIRRARSPTATAATFAFPRRQDRPALQEPRRLRRQGAGGGRRRCMNDRLLLQEDADRYLEKARNEPRVSP